MAGGSGTRRSTVEALDALLDLATQRLLTHSLDALATLVTPSTLARSTRSVSVDTAYRLLGSPEHTIELLTNRIITPEFSSDALEWPTFGDVYSGVVDSYSTAGALDGARDALRALIVGNFSLPSTVIGRIVAATTMTVSDTWEGSARIRPERLEIGRRIHEGSRRSLHRLDDDLACLLRIVLVELRRRPRPGLTIERVVVLLRMLVDGAVDRLLLDPGCSTVDEVVDATIQLGFALTEEGLLPDALAHIEVPDGFPIDAVVITAEANWSPEDDVLASVATACTLPEDELRAVFADVDVLADAVVSALVVGGPIEGSRDARYALLSAALRRLATTADTHPDLVGRALRRDGADTALGDLRAAAESLASDSTSPTVEPRRLAEQVVTSAASGTAHWETTRFLLDLSKQ